MKTIYFYEANFLENYQVTQIRIDHHQSWNVEFVKCKTVASLFLGGQPTEAENLMVIFIGQSHNVKKLHFGFLRHDGPGPVQNQAILAVLKLKI